METMVEDVIKETAGTCADAKCSGPWRPPLPVCHRRHPWNWPWGTQVGIDNNESRATNNLYRKELTALRRDLAATPNKHLVCRAPICLLKDLPHPIFPAFLLTTTELTRDIPHLVVTCTNRCRIGYHHQCWKKMTSERKKKNKEMCKPSAKKTCPTDDCGGVVLHEQHM